MLAEQPWVDVLPSVWGIAVIVTTDIADNVALVGDFSLPTELHVRQSMIVEANNRSDSDWSTNETTFKCELRGALAIKRPRPSEPDPGHLDPASTSRAPATASRAASERR